MPDFLKDLRTPIVFAALVLVATLTMVSDRRVLEEGGSELPWWQSWVFEIVAPIEKLVAAPFGAVRNVWRGYIDLVDVRNENEELRLRVAELEGANLQYREALVDSGHLQRIAAMRHDFEIPMLPAKVVGLDVSLWLRSVLVDRGSIQGVRAGNPVITNDGVVGHATAVSPRASRIMLLLDRQSVIDGLVQGSRARGVVRGNGTGELEFEFIVRGNDVKIGDLIITSGLDSVYPKGLRIGTVTGLSDPEGQLMQTAILRPAVDFGRLEQIFLMFHRGPAMELLYGQPDSSSPAVSVPREAEAPPREITESEAGPDPAPPPS